MDRDDSTDVPLFILTVAILYLTWRLLSAERRKLPPPVSLRIWKVKEFDPGTVVGAYRVRGATEYLPISCDEDIARALEERSDLLISGRPGIGKSHAAVHAIQTMYPKWLLIYPPRLVVRHANQIRLKRKRYILLLDDLEEFTQVEDETTGVGVFDLIRGLRAQAKELIVVATIRSTLPEAGAITENLKSLARWAQVELADWTEEQGRKLAQMASVDMKSWDHTPLSVKCPSQEIIERCRRSSVEARVVAKALKLCRDCGLGPVRREVLRAIYVSEFLDGKP